MNQHLPHARSRTAPRVLAPLLLSSVALVASSGVHAQRAREAGAVGTITIEMTPLRDSEGVIRAALYDSAGRWLSYEGAVAVCVAAAHVGSTRCTFGPVPAGEYAAAVLHDADGDGEMDSDWAGIPAEGYAFSNDAPVVFAPPSFSSATFRHGVADQLLSIHARYGLGI